MEVVYAHPQLKIEETPQPPISALARVKISIRSIYKRIVRSVQSMFKYLRAKLTRDEEKV